MASSTNAPTMTSRRELVMTGAHSTTVPSQRRRSTLKACTAGRRGYNSRASASEPPDVERRAPRKRRCAPGKQQKEVSMRQYTTPIAILAALLVGYFAANRTVPAQAQSGGPASHADADTDR